MIRVTKWKYLFILTASTDDYQLALFRVPWFLLQKDGSQDHLFGKQSLRSAWSSILTRQIMLKCLRLLLVVWSGLNVNWGSWRKWKRFSEQSVWLSVRFNNLIRFNNWVCVVVLTSFTKGMMLLTLEEAVVHFLLKRHSYILDNYCLSSTFPFQRRWLGCISRVLRRWIIWICFSQDSGKDLV